MTPVSTPLTMPNQNLFVALRNAFPADLDSIAVETDDGLEREHRVFKVVHLLDT